MFILKFRQRPATTLVELMLFTAFFAVSSGAMIAFFFSTSEQRVRQQAISKVEQSGVQLMQTLSNRIRSAERIIAPTNGASGSILVLQLSDESLNPTVLGLSGATLFVGEANILKQLTADEMSMTNFTVRNTSVTNTRASVLVGFTLRYTTEITTEITYSRTFEAAISLFPDDIESDQCGCDIPSCQSGQYEWQYCEEESCMDAEGSIPCTE